MKIYESRVDPSSVAILRRVESQESSAKTRSSQVFCPRPSTFVPRPVSGSRPSSLVPRLLSAFTLVEMLVVMAILGVLAALLVPALKNFGHADAMTAATRQILDDVGRTRQLAISHHTTVYMVFVPANFWSNPVYNDPVTSGNWWSSLTFAQQTAVTNLCDKQLTGYTFMVHGAVGDQPGRHVWHYLAPWQTLPDNTFIVQGKFDWPANYFYISAYNPSAPIYGFFNNNAVPLPTEDATSLNMPYIAFNYLGQLTTNGIDAAVSHEYIPLARGSVSPAWDPATKVYQLNPPDITEVPPDNSVNTYNIIDIEPLTGRATLQQPKVK